MEVVDRSKAEVEIHAYSLTARCSGVVVEGCCLVRVTFAVSSAELQTRHESLVILPRSLLSPVVCKMLVSAVAISSAENGRANSCLFSLNDIREFRKFRIC